MRGNVKILLNPSGVKRGPLLMRCRRPLVRQRLTNIVIGELFPRMRYPDIVRYHYLVRNKEVFCCVQDTWWQIEAHWKEYPAPRESDEDSSWELIVDSLTQVDPPTDVLYVRSGYMNWDGENEFSPCDKQDVEMLVYEDNNPPLSL